MPDVTEAEIKRVCELADEAEIALRELRGVPLPPREQDRRNDIIARFECFANPAFVKRLASELLSLRKSSHSVSQCCPMSERLQKRVEELVEAAENLRQDIYKGRLVTGDVPNEDISEMQRHFAVFAHTLHVARSALPQACTREAAAEASAKGVKGG